MSLITEEYRALNKEMHETKKEYGTCGSAFLPDILKVVGLADSQDVLDYGCGKSTLALNMPFPIKQYDPAIPKYEALPEPADIVVCTEVFEHVEEECLDDIITHIASLMKKFGYFTTNIRPAKKHLPDGRNAHILLRSPAWWAEKFFKSFDVLNYLHSDRGNLVFLVKSKDYEHEQKIEKAPKDEPVNEVPHEASASESVRTGIATGEPKQACERNVAGNDLNHEAKQPASSDFYRF